MDRLLDKGARGPLFLRRPEIAGLVVDALRDGDRQFHRYQLHAFVVMPNHVHVLVTPKVIATYIEQNPVTAGLGEDSRAVYVVERCRLKGGCSQDWLPHKTGNRLAPKLLSRL